MFVNVISPARSKVSPPRLLVIVLPSMDMLSTVNAVSVPTFVRLEFTTPDPSVVPVRTFVPSTL